MTKNNKYFFVSISVLLFLLTFGNLQVFAENKLIDLERNKNELLINSENSQKLVDGYELELETTKDEIKSLEGEIISITSTINETNHQITTTESNIVRVEKEIDETILSIENLEIDLEEKKDLLEQNLLLMHSRGEVEFLEFIFRAENLSQFLFRFQFMNDIVKKGEELHREIRETLLTIERQKNDLLENQASLTKNKNNLVKLKNEQITQRDEQKIFQEQFEKKQSQLQNNIVAEEKAIESIMAEISNAENLIKNEKHRIEEAKKKAIEERQRQLEREKREAEEEAQRQAQRQAQAQEQGQTQEVPKEVVRENIVSTPNLGSGSLGLPMNPGTYRISSGYGNRNHPVFGGQRFHNGLDFAAPNGTPIYASEEGYVLFSGPANGYGHWIVITHPNGLYTIYGHMYRSGLKVNAGQYVFKGQHIANVGSDGYSTGPHLHYSVANSFNGGSFSYVNPNNYFTP